MVLESNCLALFCRGACCLSGVGFNLPGTVLLGCRLFKLCQNLPDGHGVAGRSEPSSWALWGRGAGCLRGVRTYLPCNVGQGCRLFKQCRNLP